MKRHLLVFLMLLGLVQTGMAQVDKSRLERVKDFVDGRVTWLMLSQKVANGTNDFSKSDLAPLEPKLDVPGVEGALDSGQLMTLLSAKFKKTIGKLSRPIAAINTDGMTQLRPRAAAEKLVDTAFSILAQGYGTEFKTLESNKSSLVPAIVLYLTPPAVQTPETVVAASVPTPTPGAKPGIGWRLYFLLALPVTLCLVLGFFAWRFYERIQELTLSQEKLEKQLKNVAKQSKGPEVTDSRRKTGPDHSVEISELNAQLNLLKRRVAQLENQGGDLRPDLGARQPPDVRPGAPRPTRKEPPAPPPSDSIFYLTLPINNYFLDKSKSPTRDNTVYLFTAKPDGNEAAFTVHVSGTQLTDILSRTETFIKPACVEENLPSSGTKSIRNIQPGAAFLEGDKWVIKTKAVIRYE